MSTPQQIRTGETLDVDRTDEGYRSWLKEAVRKVQADANRSADTHLL
ncbi:PLP-dependent cysteine synthase family protein, partial [Streptomyces sp. NPDC127574]